MPSHIPHGSMIPNLWCVVCRENTCTARTGTSYGLFIWQVENVEPPEPGEDLWPWLHGRIRQGWWDRICMRGVA